MGHCRREIPKAGGRTQSEFRPTIVDANDFALLCICNNCKDDIWSRIGTYDKAYEALKEKTSLVGKNRYGRYLPCCCQQFPIWWPNDHHWGACNGIWKKVEYLHQQGLGLGLHFLQTLPTFYSNTVENTRTKESQMWRQNTSHLYILSLVIIINYNNFISLRSILLKCSRYKARAHTNNVSHKKPGAKCLHKRNF